MGLENGDVNAEGPRGIRSGWMVNAEGASRRMNAELEDGGGADVPGK